MRLPMIASQKGKYVLLALDKPVFLADQIGLNYALSEVKTYIDALVAIALEIYTPYVTGVSYSPESQIQMVSKKTGQAGAIFPIERTAAEVDPYSVPTIASRWGIESIRNNYGVAKLALSVSPEEKELPTKMQLVSEIYDSCKYEGIDLILELRLLDAKAQKAEQYQAVLRLLRRYCHLLAIEFPGSVVEATSLGSVMETPWVVLDTQSDYAAAKEQLRDALAADAAGMIISRSVWPQGKEFGQDGEKARQFFQTDGLDRLKELARIVEES